CLSRTGFSRIPLCAARDGQLEILTERIEDVRDTWPMTKDAAACFVGKARRPTKHAASEGWLQEGVRPELMMGHKMHPIRMHPSRRPKRPNGRTDDEDQR